jgi:hypothetical protein
VETGSTADCVRHQHFQCLVSLTLAAGVMLPTELPMIRRADIRATTQPVGDGQDGDGHRHDRASRPTCRESRPPARASLSSRRRAASGALPPRLQLARRVTFSTRTVRHSLAFRRVHRGQNNGGSDLRISVHEGVQSRIACWSSNNSSRLTYVLIPIVGIQLSSIWNGALIRRSL